MRTRSNSSPDVATAPAIVGRAQVTAVRPVLAGSLRVALILLVAVAVGGTGIVVELIWSAHQAFQWLIALYALEGLADICIGALAWDRRPSNRTGALLCVLGAFTVVSAAGNAADPLVAAVGSILGEVLIASLLHLVLAFPSGRLASGPARALVVTMYVVTVGLKAPQYVFGAGAGTYPSWGLHVDLRVVDDCSRAASWAGAAILLLTCAEKVRQVRAQRRGGSRSHHLGVFVYGIGTLAFIALSGLVLGPLLHFSGLVVFESQMVVFAWIPFVYALGVLRPGFARTGHIEQLGAWLRAGGSDLVDLRDALAATVGDPSLQLLAAGDGPAPALHPGRGVVRIDGTAGALATVVYDRALIDDPGPVRAASQLAAVAIERQQLSAELLESRRMVRESRTRLVEVADQERRRLAQDLHDMLQNRLVLAAIHAGRLSTAPSAEPTIRDGTAQLRDELQELIADLRHRLHGLLPALLLERGLPAAIEDFTDRLPLPTTVDIDDDERPLPPAVASTGYFIVVEAVTNSLKHAGASSLSVRLARHGPNLVLIVGDDGVGGARPVGGAGLRGIIDRVEGLNGTLDVDSPPGGGTTILVELPCGS
jgi:signal transduction histidine kinase